MTTMTDFIECGYNWTGPVLGESTSSSGIFSTAQSQNVIGFIACAIASLFFGSNFVPLKFIETGDGFFCQWVMCTGIFLTGLAVQLIRQQPVFFPWTLLGGAIWTTGNCCTVPIINLLGLSIGMLIWNSCSVLLGWASSLLGLFGICSGTPSNPILNYSGVVLCLFAAVAYVFVKPETSPQRPRFFGKCCCRNDVTTSPQPSSNSAVRHGELVSMSMTPDTEERLLSAPQQTKSRIEEAKFLPKLPQIWRRFLGVTMGIFAGACYSVQFFPAINTQNHVIVDGKRASQNGLDYVFSQFCGIYLASTVYFAIYAAINNRQLSLGKTNVVLPSLLCGITWGIATCSFFVANATLSPVITFPIITTVPGMIATLWGVLMFREIKGRRNFLILAAAFILTISGVILTALSK